jgi:hypothetical protein
MDALPAAAAVEATALCRTLPVTPYPVQPFGQSPTA